MNGLNPDTNLQDLDLIDLLSERHTMVRRIIEKDWNNRSEIYLSNSEWYIMARIYKKQATLSYVNKTVDISRQAIHKFIKNLEAKGLVEVGSVENNKKEKSIRLTAHGEQCYEESRAMKAQLEEKIAAKLGEAQVAALKELLRMDWDLT